MSWSCQSTKWGDHGKSRERWGNRKGIEQFWAQGREYKYLGWELFDNHSIACNFHFEINYMFREMSLYHFSSHLAHIMRSRVSWGMHYASEKIIVYNVNWRHWPVCGVFRQVKLLKKNWTGNPSPLQVFQHKILTRF